MQLKIYGHASSPNTNSVVFLLFELKREFEFTPIALERGEQHSAFFSSINSFRRVPVLEYGTFKLAESRAILRYLCAHWHAYSYYPFNLEEKAVVDMWIDYTSYHIGAAITNLAWHRYWLPRSNGRSDPRAIDSGLIKLDRELPILEARLLDHHFLCGYEITLADICFFPMAATYLEAGISWQNYPSISRWFQAIEARFAWQQTLDLQSGYITS